MLALHSGSPIAPVHLRGLQAALPRLRHWPAPARVRVRFGAPLDPAPYRAAVRENRIERREAYQQLTAALRAAIVRMGAEP